MSATVQAGIDAVENADAQTDGKTPPSAEVNAQARIDEHESGKGKKAPKAKPAAEKKPGKYDDATKDACKRAQKIRGKKNAVAPVTVTRVVAALKKAKVEPDAVVKSFASIKAAKEYASAEDKSIKAPQLVADLNEKIDDPFARSRGLVSISLALAGK
jgi:hypothetical protein